MASSPVPLPLKPTLAALPALHATSKVLRNQIRQTIRCRPDVPILVALDDDPTGTQTCHGIPVLTTWSVPALSAEFAQTAPGSGFFILTNSRALFGPAAKALIVEICQNLKEAAGGRPFEVVLRGDSTLRGHFPLECDAVEEVLGERDAWVRRFTWN